MKQLILAIIFFCCSIAFAADAVIVGHSQSSTATAYNTSRKIARTQTDRRVVVFQDIVDNQHVIKLVFSDNGVEWSDAIILGDGHSPCIAVSSTDTFYIAFSRWHENVIKLYAFDADDLPSLDNANHINIYFGEPGQQHGSPVIDFGHKFLHLVFETVDTTSNLSVIRYGLFFPDLEPATHIFSVSSRFVRATRPTLQTDLEYASDYINLFWNEVNGDMQGIHHLSMNALAFYTRSPQSQLEFEAQLNDFCHINETFPQFMNCANVSISVRADTVQDIYDNKIILACDNPVEKLLKLYTLDYNTRTQAVDIRGGYTLNSQSFTWPSVDDVIVNPRSCAIVWENLDNILYGQSKYADIVTDPPVAVSSTGNAHYPSVCYKTFSPDYFDVVWTQIDSARYSIVYRRMQKVYWFDRLVILTDTLQAGTYLDPDGYEQPIVLSGGQNKPILQIISGSLPAGLELINSHMGIGHSWLISGIPKQSGTFPLTFQAHDLGQDFAQKSEPKTRNLVIHNSAPVIDADSTLVAHPGSTVTYRFNVTDPEENEIEVTVENKPWWLTQNAQSLTGIAPDSILSTNFTLRATDHDKESSVKVNVRIDYLNTVSDLGIPTDYRLLPAFPNPFNNSTTIKLGIPDRQRVVIQIFDTTGRLVKNVHDNQLDAGWHELHFRGDDLASGSYFIRMQAANFTRVQKCLLLK